MLRGGFPGGEKWWVREEKGSPSSCTPVQHQLEGCPDFPNPTGISGLNDRASQLHPPLQLCQKHQGQPKIEVAQIPSSSRSLPVSVLGIKVLAIRSNPSWWEMRLFGPCEPHGHQNLQENGTKVPTCAGQLLQKDPVGLAPCRYQKKQPHFPMSSSWLSRL